MIPAAAHRAEVRCLLPLQIDARPPALGAVVHTLEGRTMGTGWQLRCAGPSALSLPALQGAVERVLATVVAQMSHWEAGSDLGRYNRAPAGAWCVLPAEMQQVLACALQIAQASGGAYDPAAGALVNLWGFGPGSAFASPDFRAPTADAIAEALASGGWSHVRVDEAGPWLLQPGGVQLDFSAIAKGFAVDQIAELLQRAGLPDHLVEVGGELRGAGTRPDGQPWWVELERPPGADALPTTRIALHGLAVATSGDYLRSFDDGGRRRSHTIDPRSGAPIAHGLASVSVMHSRCMEADAWSTALTVLGPEQGAALAAELGLAASFVRRCADGGFDETMSPAWAALAA